MAFSLVNNLGVNAAHPIELIFDVAAAEASLSSLVTKALTEPAVKEPSPIHAMKRTLPIERVLEALQEGEGNTVLEAALREFRTLATADQWKVFEEMWRICGRPRENSDAPSMRGVVHRRFGEIVFLGTSAQSLDVPEDRDMIDRSATSRQRTVALELYRTPTYIAKMMEFINANAIQDQVCLLETMPRALKEQLVAALQANGPSDKFNDPSITQEQRLQAASTVMTNYHAMRERIEPLCLEYEYLAIINMNTPRRMEILEAVLREAFPFTGSSSGSLQLTDLSHNGTALDYAKAVYAANGREVLPFLALLEPALVFEEIAEASRITPLSEGAPEAPVALVTSDLAQAIMNRAQQQSVTPTIVNPSPTHEEREGITPSSDPADAAESVDTDRSEEAVAAESIAHQETARLTIAAYKRFVTLAVRGKKTSLEEVFRSMAGFIPTVLFPSAAKAKHKASAVQEVIEGKDVRSVIEEGEGSSAQQAYVANYFITELMKDWPKIVPEAGSVSLQQGTTLTGSSHSWVWYKHPVNGNVYHLDPKGRRTFAFKMGAEPTAEQRSGYGKNTFQKALKVFA